MPNNVYTTADLRAHLSEALKAPKTGSVTDISNRGDVFATITPVREGKTVKKMIDVGTPGNEVLTAAISKTLSEIANNPDPMDIRDVIDRMLEKAEFFIAARREGLQLPTQNVQKNN